MTRNTLKQIQILPIWFNKTAILTVHKVNIHKFIRSNLIKTRFLTKRILLNYIYGRFPFNNNNNNSLYSIKGQKYIS